MNNERDVILSNLLNKKIPAVFLTAAVLFATVFSMAFFANSNVEAASSFTPRLSAPAKSNKYYYSDMNIFYKYGYGMPNCTAYAYGRAYEILGSKPNLCPYNAEEWYNYNKTNGYYKYGSTAKLGAIACWSSSNGGHVAVVEKIENGTITLSNSGWGYKEFYLETAKTSDPKVGQNSWTFQGYIYLGTFSSEQTTTTTTSYKTGIYKTQVENSSLNMRSGAGTSYSTVGSIGHNVSLTITKVQKGSDGYTWGYTTYKGISGWIALDFCKYISDIPTTTVQPTTVKPTTQPTTAQPTTAQPTTVQPTTAQPTTSVGLGVGDIDNDGQHTIDDVTLIQMYLANLIELTDEQIKNSDFDFDGSVTVNDVTSMQMYLAYYKM